MREYTWLRSPRENEKCAWCGANMTNRVTCVSRGHNPGYCSYKCLEHYEKEQSRAQVATGKYCRWAWNGHVWFIGECGFDGHKEGDYCPNCGKLVMVVETTRDKKAVLRLATTAAGAAKEQEP